MKGWKIFGLIMFLLVAAYGGYVGLQEYRQIQLENARLRQVQRAQQLEEQRSVPSQVRRALETKLRLAFIMDISYDRASKTLTIVDNESDPSGGLDQSTQLNQTTYLEILRRGYFLFVHGGKEIFAIDGIDNFELTQKAPFFENGVENTDITLKFKVSKAKFLSVDWKKYELKLVHDPIAKVTGGYFANPKLKSAFPQAAALLPN